MAVRDSGGKKKRERVRGGGNTVGEGGDKIKSFPSDKKQDKKHYDNTVDVGREGKERER